MRNTTSLLIGAITSPGNEGIHRIISQYGGVVDIEPLAIRFYDLDGSELISWSNDDFNADAKQIIRAHIALLKFLIGGPVLLKPWIEAHPK